ncbi:MAG: hypothetical protein LBI36_05075, partial [Oscillospiraceae bacterium]|nr:hypothetical protein [Oscillospiraceae bacterium]
MVIYSELSKLDGERGLRYDADELALTGEINGYGTVIADDKRAGEFILAVFAETGSSRDFGALYETVPKNAVNRLDFKETAVSVKLSAYPLSQGNLPLLLEAADVITNALAKDGRAPLPADKSAIARLKAAPAAKKTSPRLGVKPALFGTLGAVVGAGASCLIAIMT